MNEATPNTLTQLGRAFEWHRHCQQKTEQLRAELAANTARLRDVRARLAEGLRQLPRLEKALRELARGNPELIEQLDRAVILSRGRQGQPRGKESI